MPFSGKTTLGKSMAKYINSFYISLDEINEARGLFGGDGISVREWSKTHRLAMQQLQSLMQSRQDIIVDDTNCFRWLRDRFRNFVKPHDYQTIVVYLDIPLATIQERMAQNRKTQVRHSVKQDIVEGMAQTFELPQEDENVVKYDANQPIDEWIAEHFVGSLD